MTVEVTKDQLTALMRGEAVAVGPSKRVVTLEDGPFAVRHYGPGPHPGTGTPQEVHGGGGVRAGTASRGSGSEQSKKLRKEYRKLAEAGSGEYLPKEWLHSSHDLFEHIPGTERWDRVRDALDAIDAVHGVDFEQAFPLAETRSKSKGGAYITERDLPKRFIMKIEDNYGESTEISTAHEIGHYLDHWLFTVDSPRAPRWMSREIAEAYPSAEILGDKVVTMWDEGGDSPTQNDVDWVVSQATHDVNVYERYGEMTDKEIVYKGFDVYHAIRQSQGYQDLMTHRTGQRAIQTPDDWFYDGPAGRERQMPRLQGSQRVVLGQSMGIWIEVTRPVELFARAYSQYIALRSDDFKMKRTINESLNMQRAGAFETYWEWDDFEPIANAFDGLFREKQWLKP